MQVICCWSLCLHPQPDLHPILAVHLAGLHRLNTVPLNSRWPLHYVVGRSYKTVRMEIFWNAKPHYLHVCKKKRLYLFKFLATHIFQLILFCISIFVQWSVNFWVNVSDQNRYNTWFTVTCKHFCIQVEEASEKLLYRFICLTLALL